MDLNLFSWCLSQNIACLASYTCWCSASEELLLMWNERFRDGIPGGLNELEDIECCLSKALGLHQGKGASIINGTGTEDHCHLEMLCHQFIHRFLEKIIVYNLNNVATVAKHTWAQCDYLPFCNRRFPSYFFKGDLVPFPCYCLPTALSFYSDPGSRNIRCGLQLGSPTILVSILIRTVHIGFIEVRDLSIPAAACLMQDGNEPCIMGWTNERSIPTLLPEVSRISPCSQDYDRPRGRW